jgi:peptidyl-prolyl cis-trans isomerase D
MFDFVKNRRLIVGAIVVLLAIPFAFFGIDSYFRGGDAVDQVASVAGTDISGREYNEALRQRQEQLRQAMRGEVDAEMLNSPEVRQAVLDQLVNERVIYASALKSGVTVTPAELHTVISEIPAFRENGGTGEFSRALYESVLRSQGMSEQAFEALLRKDLIMNRARQSVATTAFLPASVADRLYRLRAQEREVSQLVLAPQQFAARVTIEPDAVQAYYEANPAQFEVAEKVRVEYAILSLAGVQQQVQVTPEQIREYYEERRAQFEKPEERRASHILITVPPDATPEQKTQAREKAEKVLAAAKQAPKDFAELAKENSEDPGSAMEGGDLGFFPRGRMVRSFDDAVFGMQVGEIAGPVESQFGFHIIRLEFIQPAEGPKFETVQGEVGEELRKAQAGRRFAEAAETFSNLVYEQPDSLQPAVEALGLEAQTTGWITRAGGADNPLLNNEKFLKALFSDDALKHARNTEAVEIAPNMLVSARSRARAGQVAAVRGGAGGDRQPPDPREGGGAGQAGRRSAAGAARERGAGRRLLVCAADGDARAPERAAPGRRAGRVQRRHEQAPRLYRAGRPRRSLCRIPHQPRSECRDSRCRGAQGSRTAVGAGCRSGVGCRSPEQPQAACRRQGQSEGDRDAQLRREA